MILCTRSMRFKRELRASLRCAKVNYAALRKSRAPLRCAKGNYALRAS